MKVAFKTAPLTISLLGLMGIIYLVEAYLQGGFQIGSQVSFALGGEYPPAMIYGSQWWRLITSGFLHTSFLHFASNAVMIYYMGTIMEKVIGSWRFFMIFLLSVIGGNVLTLAYGPFGMLSVGASGGLFGLFGANIVLGLLEKDPQTGWRQQGVSMLVLAGVNLLFNLFDPSVNMLSHIGGLLTGAMVVPLFMTSATSRQLFKGGWLTTLIALLVTLAASGWMIVVIMQRFGGF